MNLFLLIMASSDAHETYTHLEEHVEESLTPELQRELPTWSVVVAMGRARSTTCRQAVDVVQPYIYRLDVD